MNMLWYLEIWLIASKSTKTNILIESIEWSVTYVIMSITRMLKSTSIYIYTDHNIRIKPGEPVFIQSQGPLPFVRVLRSHHVDYAHHVSCMCTPYASNVGDVPEYVYPFHICEATRCLSHT